MLILTDEQQVNYDRLSEEWTIVGKPSPMIGSDCVMVEVSGEHMEPSTMWLGIDPDGYIHS